MVVEQTWIVDVGNWFTGKRLRTLVKTVGGEYYMLFGGTGRWRWREDVSEEKALKLINKVNGTN